MCGIAGIASQQQDNLSQTATRMADAIIRRGPDDSGVWVQKENKLAFGFRRLAILDLTPEGHQPMSSKTCRYTMVFNGEIYNFLELKKELQNLGHQFRGGSDTEVILAGAESWGFKALLPKLNGMFAIALWDELSSTLFLARDRLGKKPLYYGWSDGNFLFSSELKALVASGKLTRALSGDGLKSYFERGYVPAPLSIYENVFKLIPGSVIELNESKIQNMPSNFDPYPVNGSSRIGPEQYWSISEVSKTASANVFRGSEESAIETAESIIQDSTQKRMISDVPLGAFLSGGIDSSLVVANMQKLSALPVKTFCIGFKEKEFDESEPARKVANYLGTQHSELIVSVKDGLGIIDSLPEFYDEPLADASQIPSILVSQMARREVTVALNGDGGDELFAGYNRYSYPEEINSKLSKVPIFARKLVVGALKSLPRSTLDRTVEWAAGMMEAGRRPSRPKEAFNKLLRLAECSNANEIYDLLTRYFPSNVTLMETKYHGSFLKMSDLNSESEFVRRAATLDIGTYLPDDLLAKIDRATMACSLEGRSPLLDYRLVEFALSLPATLKLKNGVKKYFLKKLLEKHLPRDLFDRPKVGFSLPIGSWLRNELKLWGEERIDYLEKNLSEILDILCIKEKWWAHQSGDSEFANEIWTAIIFSQWHERWMSG